jgi:hypothetical protein
MLPTYKAILLGDRLEFTGEGPQDAGPLSVVVTVVGVAAGEAGNGHGERGRAMGDALERLALLGTLAHVADPAAWQRDIRRERELPGRPTLPPKSPDAP